MTLLGDQEPGSGNARDVDGTARQNETQRNS
jgi:hypothetical protein